MGKREPLSPLFPLWRPIAHNCKSKISTGSLKYTQQKETYRIPLN